MWKRSKSDMSNNNNLGQMMKNIILSSIVLCSLANTLFAADSQVNYPAMTASRWETLNRLTYTCSGLAALDIRDFMHHADTSLVAATIVPGKGSGNRFEDFAQPLKQGGNARQYSGTIHVDYATHAVWIGNTYHFTFTVPVTAFNYHNVPPRALVFGGELVYAITGDSPVFHEVSESYLIPDGYEKYLPEAVAFCQNNVKPLQSSQTERGMLTALLESPNPFLKVMAVKGLSEDPAAMHSSTAPARMITDALSAHGELQATLVGIILCEGGVNAQNLVTAILTKVKVSREPSDYEYLALGCDVQVPVTRQTFPYDYLDRQSIFVAMAAKQLPSGPGIVHSELVDAILLGMRLPPSETSQSKLR
jgi:hypothetical protein